MLKFFNRLERTRNFVLFLFAILMVLGLVLFYTPVRNQYQANLTHSEETAAYVSGEKITVGEIIRQKENYNRMARGQTFPSKMILDGLIGSRIGRIEAARFGLTASDAEVAAEIRKQYRSDDPTKAFDQAIYEQNVMEQYGSISAYEQNVRDDLSGKKLDAFVSSGVTVSEQDVLDDFQRKNTKFDVILCLGRRQRPCQNDHADRSGAARLLRQEQSQLLHQRAAEEDQIRVRQHGQAR